MLAGKMTPSEVSTETGLGWHCVRMWLYRARKKQVSTAALQRAGGCVSGVYRKNRQESTGGGLEELKEMASQIAMASLETGCREIDLHLSLSGGPKRAETPIGNRMVKRGKTTEILKEPALAMEISCNDVASGQIQPKKRSVALTLS